MWTNSECGKLAGEIHALSKLLNCELEEFIFFLNQAHEYKFADIEPISNVTFPLHVTQRNIFVTVTNRRMVRDDKLRKNTRLRVRRHRERKQCNGGVTVASPSPSPIPPIVPQKSNASGFDEFWELYPKKVGKIDAKKAWRKIKQPQTIMPKIIAAIETQTRSSQWKKDNGQFVPNPATWLNRGSWDDELETTSEEQNRNALLMKGISLYGDKAAFAEFSQHHKFSKTELEITAWKYKEKNNE